jgi:Zn-dependent M28 family amino/carboxypeptidase
MEVFSLRRVLAGFCFLALVTTACSNPSSTVPGVRQAEAVLRAGPAGCENRSNDTVAKLDECIQRKSLWRQLSQFQRIADQNPGKDGHGNRDTGTPGYAASVDHVVGLMRQAGYNVSIQPYIYRKSEVTGTPEFRAAGATLAFGSDWFVAMRSGGGTLTAPVQPASGTGGCSLSDFARFTRGNIALLERGTCAFDGKVSNAQAAGAGAVILYDPSDTLHMVRLTAPARVPVIGLAEYAVGAELLRQYQSGLLPTAHIDVRMQRKSGLDYNVIAESPFGDPHRIVVVDAHLDSIYGAGMLDNASGSTTVLEVALNLAKTRTHNRLRYIWFGGEELGLLGSRYYTRHLSPAQLSGIVFDLDVDVTATPNFDILVADPAFASNVKRFPKNVVPESRIGNRYFADFFEQGGIVSRPARFGNDGTDSNAFSRVGIPNSGILTEQDCCKHAWETKLWGGFLGNYEGVVPGFDGGCVDMPDRWCDNLDNNDPFVLELASKAVAYVTLKLAGNAGLRR